MSGQKFIVSEETAQLDDVNFVAVIVVETLLLRAKRLMNTRTLADSTVEHVWSLSREQVNGLWKTQVISAGNCTRGTIYFLTYRLRITSQMAFTAVYIAEKLHVVAAAKNVEMMSQENVDPTSELSAHAEETKIIADKVSTRAEVSERKKEAAEKAQTVADASLVIAQVAVADALVVVSLAVQTGLSQREVADARAVAEATEKKKVEAEQLAEAAVVEAKKASSEARRIKSDADMAKRVAENARIEAEKVEVAAETEKRRMADKVAADAVEVQKKAAASEAAKKVAAEAKAAREASDLAALESTRFQMPLSPFTWPFSMRAGFLGSLRTLVVDSGARTLFTEAGVIAVVYDRSAITLVACGTGGISLISIVGSGSAVTAPKTVVLSALANFDLWTDLQEDHADALSYARAGDMTAFGAALSGRALSVLRMTDTATDWAELKNLKAGILAGTAIAPGVLVSFESGSPVNETDLIGSAILVLLWASMAASTLSMTSSPANVSAVCSLFGHSTPPMWSNGMKDDNATHGLAATGGPETPSVTSVSSEGILSLSTGQNMVAFIASQNGTGARNLLAVACGQPACSGFLMFRAESHPEPVDGTKDENPADIRYRFAISARPIPQVQRQRQAQNIPTTGVNAAVEQLRSSLQQHNQSQFEYSRGVAQVAHNVARLIMDVWGVCYHTGGVGDPMWNDLRAIPVGEMPTKAARRGPLNFCLTGILTKIASALLPNPADAGALSSVGANQELQVVTNSFTLLELLLSVGQGLHPITKQSAVSGDDWDIDTLKKVSQEEWSFNRMIQANPAQQYHQSMTAHLSAARRVGAEAFVLTLGSWLDSLCDVLSFGLVVRLQPHFAFHTMAIDYRSRKKQQKISVRRLSLGDLVFSARGYLAHNLGLGSAISPKAEVDDFTWIGRAPHFAMPAEAPISVEISCTFLNAFAVVAVLVTNKLEQDGKDGCSLRVETSQEGVGVQTVRLIGIADNSTNPGPSLAAILAEVSAGVMQHAVFVVRGVFCLQHPREKEFALVARADDPRMQAVTKMCKDRGDRGETTLMSDLPPWIASISLQAQMVRADVNLNLEVCDLQFPIPALTLARLQVMKKQGLSGWRRGTTMLL